PDAATAGHRRRSSGSGPAASQPTAFGGGGRRGSRRWWETARPRSLAEPQRGSCEEPRRARLNHSPAPAHGPAGREWRRRALSPTPERAHGYRELSPRNRRRARHRTPPDWAASAYEPCGRHDLARAYRRSPRTLSDPPLLDQLIRPRQHRRRDQRQASLPQVSVAP